MRTHSYRRLLPGKKVTSQPSSSTRLSSRPVSRPSSASPQKTSVWTRPCWSVNSIMTAWRSSAVRSRMKSASTRSGRIGIWRTMRNWRMRISCFRSRCLNSNRARWSLRVGGWHGVGTIVGVLLLFFVFWGEVIDCRKIVANGLIFFVQFVL